MDGWTESEYSIIYSLLLFSYQKLSFKGMIIKNKVLSLQCNEDKRMKKEKRNFLLNEWSKYCLDISKLIFAGVILAGIMKKDIKDKRVLKLIRKYLQSGIMINGIVVSNEEGTPQGGPLSPLLSNIMLDELDKELEKRGHRFCRYADDCNIYVKSKRAGERVMENITSFIEGKLKLKVNINKSAVERPWKRKFLGFTLGIMFGKAYSSISKQSLKKHKDKLREILSRSNPMTLEQRIIKLNQVNIGWINYYGIAKCKGIAVLLDKWIKLRLRMCIWKQWKKVKTRYKNLKKLGLNHYQAIKFANTRKGYWRVANSAILKTTLTNQFFNDLGLKSLTRQYIKIH